MELAAPEIADNVSGRKTFGTAVESVGKQTVRKLLGGGSMKRTTSENIPKNLQNKPVDREEIFSQTFLIDHFEQFSVPTFCGSFRKSLKESPSS